MVLVADPADIKRVFAAGAGAARRRELGGAGAVRRAALDPGARRRRAPAPAAADAAAVPRRGARALACHDRRRSPRTSSTRWAPGAPLRTLERMQALTLEVILRVVFGGGDAELRDAIRRALDMTASMPRLVAMSLTAAGAAVAARTCARCAGSTRCSTSGSTAAAAPTARCWRVARGRRSAAAQRAARPAGDAAGRRARDDRGRARRGRSSGSPATRTSLARMREGDDAYLDAVVKEVLRVRPVLSIDAAQGVAPFELGGWTLPPGVHVTPCIYLAHRRADAVGGPDRLPARALPRRRARALHVHPVRRRHAPLPRRRVRVAGDARGAARGRAPVRAAARPAGGRAHAPAVGHADALARRGMSCRPLLSDAMPMFCRHNRLTANCPICRRELQAELRAKAPARPPRRARVGSRGARAARRRPRGGVVTRQLARAADDGYRNPLVPGLRATADAERLAAALAAAAARLEPPGPYPEVADRARPRGGDVAGVPARARRPEAPELQDAVLAARAAWASGEMPDAGARAAPPTPTARGRSAPARRRRRSRGEAGWTPQRRFARVFERLALPGFAPRRALRPADRARRRRPLRRSRPASCTGGGGGRDDRGRQARCSCPATSCCSSAARATSRRRAEVPLAALDRGLALWGAPGPRRPRRRGARAAIRAALTLR